MLLQRREAENEPETDWAQECEVLNNEILVEITVCVVFHSDRWFVKPFLHVVLRHYQTVSIRQKISRFYRSYVRNSRSYQADS